MSYKLKVCVIDDEPQVRRALADALNESNEMEVIGEAGSVNESVELITSLRPDAVFMDIKLIEGDAFQIINILRRESDVVPPIILNTGFNDFEFAQKSLNEYNEYVIKILQKPFWLDWQSKQDEIIDSIIAYKNRNKKIFSPPSKKIKVKSAYQTWFVSPEELQYIEVSREQKSSGKIDLITKNKNFTIKRSMGSMMDYLPEQFIQINRYTIINADYISYYDHSDHSLYLTCHDASFPVGDAFYSNLAQWMEKQ